MARFAILFKLEAFSMFSIFIDLLIFTFKSCNDNRIVFLRLSLHLATIRCSFSADNVLRVLSASNYPPLIHASEGVVESARNMPA